MRWMDKLKPHRGEVYRQGQALPESEYETATGRRLYTVQQMRAAYEQGRTDERERVAELLERQHTWLTNAAASALVRNA